MSNVYALTKDQRQELRASRLKTLLQDLLPIAIDDERIILARAIEDCLDILKNRIDERIWDGEDVV